MFYSSGVPAVVDFAAMRDAMKSLGGEPSRINPICPVDLVIDHSVQVDAARRSVAVFSAVFSDELFDQKQQSVMLCTCGARLFIKC